jgi:hypothetical protein
MVEGGDFAKYVVGRGGDIYIYIYMHILLSLSVYVYMCVLYVHGRQIISLCFKDKYIS